MEPSEPSNDPQQPNKRAYYNCSIEGCNSTSYNSELSFFSIPPEGESWNQASQSQRPRDAAPAAPATAPTAPVDRKDHKRSYHNCAVLGCPNTTFNTEYTFFSLPLDGQRRDEWLRLIQRTDLLTRCSRHGRVCEVHFQPQAVLVSANRKVLKKNSAPHLFLPEKTQIDKDTQTFLFDDEPKVYSASTSSQTPKYLMKELKLKRKPLPKCEKYGRGSRFQPAPDDTERRRFLELCDKFLSRALAARVRDHAHHTPPDQLPDSSLRATTDSGTSSDDEIDEPASHHRALNTDSDDSSDDEPLLKLVKRAPVSSDEELVKVDMEPVIHSHARPRPEPDPLRPDSDSSDGRGSDNELKPAFVKIEIEDITTEEILKRTPDRITVFKMEVAPVEDEYEDDSGE